MREDCCGTQEREGSAELLGLRRLIEQTYGLVYDGPDSGLLSHAIADRMQETGSECLASYCSSVLSSPAGADELRLLVDAATVKETRFFRGKGLFEALVSQIAPDIVSRMKPARQGGRSVRAWSAGCATGDEAYSLALVLMEAARGRFLSPVRVVGTDVSASALTHAAGGVYFANALRNVDKSLLKRYFIRLPADGGPLGCAKPGPWSVRYRVGPELAACVEFIEHNLAVMPYPQHLREFDLILCRNVLMYFSTDTVARVTRELSRCLCEGGYLILDSWTAPVDFESDECSMVQCGYGVVVRFRPGPRLRLSLNRVPGANPGLRKVPQPMPRRRSGCLERLLPVSRGPLFLQSPSRRFLMENSSMQIVGSVPLRIGSRRPKRLQTERISSMHSRCSIH